MQCHSLAYVADNFAAYLQHEAAVLLFTVNVTESNLE